MQAAEVNVTLQVFPYSEGETSGDSLTGATCLLITRSPFDLLSSLPLTVSLDGTYAYRNTLATDFPMGGAYDIQLVANFTDGRILKSPIKSLDVGWSLIS